MSRFIKEGYKVAYIEPSFSIARKPDKNKISYQTNRALKISVERRNENLFIIKPPQGLPFWSKPFISRQNYRYFAFQINRTLKKINFENYILWVYRPEYAAAIGFFNYRELVIDITDDHAEFKLSEPDKFNYITKCMQTNIQRSNLVIVTAATLYEKYKEMSRNIILVPNGYDSDSVLNNIKEMPEGIEGITKPLIGFIGTLFSFLDYELLEYIIKNNPDKSFVFVGHLEENSRMDWMHITKTYKNVFWLGKKRKEDIPSYIKRFDVCLNPFKVDSVSRSISPVKVFEYLAAKKPVVSTKMESLEKEELAQFIYFASSQEEYNEKLQVALKETAVFEKKLDYEIISKYSWDNLFRKVIGSVEQAAEGST